MQMLLSAQTLQFGGEAIGHACSPHTQVMDAAVRLEPIGLTWRADACAYNASNATAAGLLPQELRAADVLADPYASAYPTLAAVLARKPCAPVDVRVVNNRAHVVGPVALFGPPGALVDTPALVSEEALNTIVDNYNLSLSPLAAQSHGWTLAWGAGVGWGRGKGGAGGHVLSTQR